MVHLGQLLSEERRRKGLSLEDVSSATKIRPAFLSAIEQDEYAKLPSATYAQGFVTNYASYLGIPRREALALFHREFDPKKSTKVLPDSFAGEKYKHKTLRIQRSSIVLIVISLFLLSYLIFQYRSVFLSPPLQVSSPTNNAIVPDNIEVKGTTDPSDLVMVNGEMVTVDQNGNFFKDLSLLPGATQIEITAQNHYGKTTIVNRTVEVR